MTERTLRLDPAQLYQRTDLSDLGFETTDELADIQEVVGQARAVDAIRFATGMRDDGFNIYALGPTGLDKRELVQQFFDALQQALAIADIGSSNMQLLAERRFATRYRQITDALLHRSGFLLAAPPQIVVNGHMLPW